MSHTSSTECNSAISQVIKTLRQEKQIIAKKKLTLEMEAEKINKMYQIVSNNSRWLVVSRVWFYRALGEALYEHRKHVLAAGHPWQEWAMEKFPFFKKTRREQCIKLATYGASLEKFYFLGIDLLYSFANLMSDLKLKGETEIQYVATFFDLNVGVNNIEHVDHCEYKVKIDKFFEYFNFKNKMNGSSYNRDMVLDAIHAGVTFSNHDYNELKELSKDPSKQDIYLFQMLVNVGTPKGTKQSSSHQDSMLIVMAKFIELADKHCGRGKFPPYMTKTMMRPFLLKVDQYYQSIPE